MPQDSYGSMRENMTVEGVPVEIIDRRVKTSRRKKTQMLQVVWDCNGREEVTWEPEERMKANFPKWFGKQVLPKKIRGRIKA